VRKVSVKVNIPHFLQHLTNDVKVVAVNGSTVGECLHDLVQRFPSLTKHLLDENSKLLKLVDVYINGESAYPDELNKPVNDGDELYIMLVLAGG